MCFFTDNELLYRTRDGDVVKLNADTKERTVIVPNQLFVSISLPAIFFNSRKYILYYFCTGCVATLSVCFFGLIQDRSRAAKYQVSPDMQHVLFAFELKPVRNPLSTGL